ncbi:hypothetical protein EV2_031392 [Malus domestica]
MLFQGLCECGLYRFYWKASNGIFGIAISLQALMIAKTDIHTWHKRLGHPSRPILHIVINKNQLPIIGSISKSSICYDCQLGKGL